MEALRSYFINAQSRLDDGFGIVIPDILAPAIMKFNADRRMTIPPRFMTGELSLGDPFQMKFFRGVAAYGTGNIEFRVYVDKTPIAIHRPVGHPQFGQTLTYAEVEMAETPDPQRVVWLPRGTKGRTINIEGAGSIKHIRSIVVFWDPLTGEEDG